MSHPFFAARASGLSLCLAAALVLLAPDGLALAQNVAPGATPADAPGTSNAHGATPAQTDNSQRITPNFTNADITQIIEDVSMVTGRNFIVDPRVRAQVTMVSSTPLTQAEFYQAFLAILEVHGFAAIPDGDVTKIIPDANMRQYPAITLPNQISATSDDVVTQVLSVKNVSAAQLVPVLRPLMPQNAQLSAVTGANILIISDRASNVERMMRIIQRIDQVGNPDYDVVTLQAATADATARVLNSLLAQNEQGSGIKIVADDRSNSIIVSGDPATRLRVRALIAQLDTPVESGTATQVRYLLYSDATDLATRLKEQMSTTRSGTGTGEPQRQFNAQPIPNAQGTTASGATPASATVAGAATISLAGGQATIWADKDTNALILTADARTMRALNAVIDKLDIRRPQVLVQAIIADVAVDRTDDLGINWAAATSSNATIGGFISPVAGSSIVDLYNDAVGGTTALASNVPTGGTFGVGKLTASGINFALMLRALQGDARTNIVGTPSIVTRDNQEAKMEVAQEVPFLTGQYSTTNGTGSAFQTIQQEDVGTLLTVTPTISEGDVVMLKVDVESSSLSSSASGVAGDPITNKNTITTTVLIKDGGTLVLGGLIQDSVTNNQQSIPLLGNIPLLGELFRTRNNEKTKSDFLIFLQPRILRDDRQSTIETDAKYNYMIDEQRNITHDSTRLPLAPYEPVDPLPPIVNGRIGSIFGTAKGSAPINAAPAPAVSVPTVTAPAAATPAATPGAGAPP